MIKIIERWSSLPDLPLEDATDIEKEKVEILRANVLKAQGLKSHQKAHGRITIIEKVKCYVI